MTELDLTVVAARYREVRDQLDQAARRGGREPSDVEIVMAGKYVPASSAHVLVDAGITVVGENRLQDLQEKYELLSDRLTFDFIGHLQRRKVKNVLPMVRLIHSLDSLALAEEIDRRASRPVTVLCQVNIAGEATKGGILRHEIDSFVEQVSAFDNVVLGGLMALPPSVEDPNDNRPHFVSLRELNERLAREWGGRHTFGDLSMGTSQDFCVAAEEGATRVRIGRTMMTPSR